MAKDKKEEKKKVPDKKLYDVRVECLLPTTLHFRILAETPEEAAELMKKQQPNMVKYRLIGRKDIKLTVYDAGSTIIRFIKNLVGILR